MLCDGFQSVQILLDAGVVNTQEFIGSGHHVDVVVFAFAALLVQILKDSIISMCCLQDTGHGQKECLPQVRSAALGYTAAMRLKGS